MDMNGKSDQVMRYRAGKLVDIMPVPPRALIFIFLGGAKSAKQPKKEGGDYK